MWLMCYFIDSGQGHKWVKNYRAGSHELFLSNHEDIIQIKTICGMFEAISSIFVNVTH